MQKLDKDVDYRKIPGFYDYYIGSDGSIWSTKVKFLGHNGEFHRLKVSVQKIKKANGHYSIGWTVLFKDGKSYRKIISHLVFEVFVGKRPDGYVCCHNDGCSLNNHLHNLRWGTRSDNEKDKIKHGTSNRGNRNGRSKLQESDVLEIRDLCSNSELSLSEIGKIYGVNAQAIHKIKNRERWSWL